MSTSPGVVKRLWLSWKSLRLPWRKKWLVGFDLAGNSFWEFKDALNANRLRRIVHYDPKAHYGDIKLSPSWIQWLRHTRYEAPTVSEQQLDLQRQAQIKQLAAQADARWAAQASYLQPPKSDVASNANGEHPQELGRVDVKGLVEELVEKSTESVRQLSDQIRSASTPKRAKKEVRWEELRLGKSDGEPQPDTWVPRPAKRN